jgi:hypothetical protein
MPSSTSPQDLSVFNHFTAAYPIHFTREFGLVESEKVWSETDVHSSGSIRSGDHKVRSTVTTLREITFRHPNGTLDSLTAYASCKALPGHQIEILMATTPKVRCQVLLINRSLNDWFLIGEDFKKIYTENFTKARRRANWSCGGGCLSTLLIPLVVGIANDYTGFQHSATTRLLAQLVPDGFVTLWGASILYGIAQLITIEIGGRAFRRHVRRIMCIND